MAGYKLADAKRELLSEVRKHDISQISYSSHDILFQLADLFTGLEGSLHKLKTSVTSMADIGN